ncbi:MAG: ABC transporter substrate-binding protein [Crocinitomicaceae bacterium]
MNKSGVAFALAFSFITLFSCQGEKEIESESQPKETVSSEIKVGGSLRLAISDEISILDPKFVYAVNASQIVSMIYEPIVKFNPKTLEIEPLIAESFEIADSNKTFTFKIRKGVLFQNDECFPGGKGRELTANDVKYTFEYYCKQDSKEMSVAFNTVFNGNVIGIEDFVAGRADEITGIQVDGDKVTIQLSHPNADFLKQLASPSASILAKEVIECKGLNRGAGTGPFMVQSNNSKGILLVKNPNYYLKDEKGVQLPYIDSVSFKVIPSKIDQLISFEEGEIEYIDGLPSGKIKYMVEENIRNFDEVPPKYVLAHEPQLSVEYYGFNLTKSYFKDKRVRKAISFAINRQSIYDKILKRQAYSPGQAGVVPPIKLFKGYDFDKVQENSYSYNPEKARKLMAEAGYPDGKGFPKITIEYNQNDQNFKVAAEIQEQLKKTLNIDLQIEAVSFDKKVENSNYARTDLFRAAWVGDYPSPQTMLLLGYGKHVPKTLDKPSHPNSMRFVNTEFDRLYEKAIESSTEEESFKYYAEAESIFMDEAPVVVLWYYEDNQILHSYVRDLHFNEIKYLDFRSVWLKEWTEAEYKEYIKK